MKDNSINLRKAALLGMAAIPFSCTNNPHPEWVGKHIQDFEEVFPEEATAPEGAPNVLWILLDDVGYAASSAFGGLIDTPTFDSLAEQGMCYTNFHTTGLSAPSRAALLTGRNHHTAHMGNFAHQFRRAGFPGYDGIIPTECGTIAEILHDNGYSTFALGKYGLTPDNEANDAGPFDHWPQGKGFDHFYGFIASSTDNYNPQLVDELNYVRPDGRNIHELLTDRAIQYVDRQKAARPDRPFFMYLAPQATHSPIQAPKEWIDKFKGRFDDGWDAYREKTFARQMEMGMVPANAVLPPREEHLKAWDELSADEKKVFARMMEAYAGYLAYCDYELGRFLSHLDEMGELDNTLIITIIGDNGAEKGGTHVGTFDRNVKTGFPRKFKTLEERFAYTLAHYDEIGTPSSNFLNLPIAWTQALDTPYRNWKGFAESEGGTRNPMIITWPGHVQHGIREQFCHLVDVLPTTLDMVGVEMPETVKNVKQIPLQGKSLTYTFDNPDAPEQHTEQYFFIYSSRAIYKDGWKASIQFPNDIWNTGEAKGKTDDDMEWHLYNMKEDPTELVDLAKENPRKLKQLQKLMKKVSIENNVYPYFRRTDISDKNRPINQRTKEEDIYYRRLFGGPSKYEDVEPVY